MRVAARCIHSVVLRHAHCSSSRSTLSVLSFQHKESKIRAHLRPQCLPTAAARVGILTNKNAGPGSVSYLGEAVSTLTSGCRLRNIMFARKSPPDSLSARLLRMCLCYHSPCVSNPLWVEGFKRTSLHQHGIERFCLPVAIRVILDSVIFAPSAILGISRTSNASTLPHDPPLSFSSPTRNQLSIGQAW